LGTQLMGPAGDMDLAPGATIVDVHQNYRLERKQVSFVARVPIELISVSHARLPCIASII